jgi:dTDP-4-dehydrorhamnose reductase
MRILITGAHGQLGSALADGLHANGEIFAYSHDQMDITSAADVEDITSSIKPNVIINTAAYTNVDGAENNKDLAYAVNIKAVENLVNAAKKNGAFLIHFSTDYVFDGTRCDSYDETTALNPINVYGETKAAADRFIMANLVDFAIFRVAWLYGINGNNFPAKILAAAAKKPALTVVDDQVGTPTSVDFITAAIKVYLQLDPSLKKSFCGVFNLVPNGCASWYDFAIFLLETAIEKGADLQCLPATVSPIKSMQINQAAKRPRAVKLNNYAIQQLLNVKFADWRGDAIKFVDDHLRSQNAI